MSMMNKKWISVVLLLLSTASFSHPASMEYVNSELGKVRNELNAQIYSVNARNQQQTDGLNQLRNELNSQVNIGTATNRQQIETLSALIDQIQLSVNQLPLVTHQIGEIFQGGMVFYIDNTKQHGLMVSLSELGESIEWRNGEGGDRITNAKGYGLGSGESNTRLIIAEQTIDAQEGSFAALMTHGYQIHADGKTPCSTHLSGSELCYGGWYLPSIYELVLLQANLKQSGLANLLDGSYWSSTEYDTTHAFAVDFNTGETRVEDKATPAYVRAIRNF